MEISFGFARLAAVAVATWFAHDARAAAAREFLVDGVPLTAAAVDVVRTPSGHWPVFDLGKVAEGRAYLFEKEGLPGWYSFCIVRWPDGDGDIDERLYRLTDRGKTIDIRALPGSMKCADTGEPVKPSAERLRDAVAAGRVVPYSSKAFRGFAGLAKARSDGDGSDYRPDRIYGRSSSNNAIGRIVGSAGEAGSSRGFLSETDAAMIAAAMAGDGSKFAAFAARARVDVLYGLSLPNFVIWSPRNHQMRDPQIPFAGDRPYFNEGGPQPAGDSYQHEGKWCAPADYPYLGEIGAKAGQCYAHTRDEAHLFNHGFAYWLATGDPRAAILQQTIAAYALASNYQRRRGAYWPRFGYQRTTLNQFSALWKLRDVAENASTARGQMIWPKPRARKIADDMWRGWKQRLGQLDASSTPADRSVSIVRGIDSNADNAYSSYMLQAYGPEAAYLWASAGEPALMRRMAEHFVLRYGTIGGARGHFGTGVGSGFPILKEGRMPYEDRNGLVAWINANSPHPADSFDAAPVHYVIRGYWVLQLARDAVRRRWMPAVPGLDEAIARTERARDATSNWRGRGSIGWKHGAIPLGT